MMNVRAKSLLLASAGVIVAFGLLALASLAA